MNHRIYFADKSLLIKSVDDSAADPAQGLSVDGPITRAKVLKFFETSNDLLFSVADPDAAFDAFSREFCVVTAAGGVVSDPEGRMLMIRRNDRWDLPKGHLEAGEGLEACALREVEEETGVRADAVIRPLGSTIHCYDLYGRWEMKYTYWYEMRVGRTVKPSPQREEGIVEVRWCTPEEVRTLLKSSYPTIRTVFRTKGGI